MINRQVIRTRVLQVAYAYLHKDGHKLQQAEQELAIALGRSYELYLYLLRLPIDLTDEFVTLQELRKAKYFATEAERNPSDKLRDNRFVAALRKSEVLESWYNDFSLSWSKEQSLLRDLLQKIEESELYQLYLREEEGYDNDLNFWLAVYQQIVLPSPLLADYLEAQSIYWDESLCTIEKIECEERPKPDEVETVVKQAQKTEGYQGLRYDNGNTEIVKAFVLKTMRRATEGEDIDSLILPQYRDEDDERFALHLLRQAILNYDKHADYIAKHLSDAWQEERLADLDRLLMHLAVTEFLYCPSIPTSISINEYVELAKHYSTPKSSAFVNGILDAIAQELKQTKQILKQ